MRDLICDDMAKM